jgi:hypothetical protein
VYSNFAESKSDHVAVFVFRTWEVIPDAPKSPEIMEYQFFLAAALPDDTTAATHRRLQEILGGAPREVGW